MTKRNFCLLLVFTFCFKYAVFGQQLLNDSLLKETEIRVDTGSFSLFGTLMVPDVKQKIPVVLIIPGSGPTDRNGNNPFGLSTDTYKLLAKNLAQNGIASLRFDKRGVAKSTPALAAENLLTFGTYVSDAGKWYRLLKEDPRFSRIIVLGHSEGALIGTMTANFERADAFISISGTSMRADSLLISQLSKQSQSMADTAKTIIEHIMKDEPFYPNKDLISIFRPSVSRYLKSWFKLSPVIEISILRCPALIVQGTNDLQVSVDDANKLAAARPMSKLVIIEKMNHVLKNSPSDFGSNIATYRDPSLPLSAELVPALVSFIATLK
jgi:pimeloyl-ACP methyl ester carboxylesterase